MISKFKSISDDLEYVYDYIFIGLLDFLCM